MTNTTGYNSKAGADATRAAYRALLGLGEERDAGIYALRAVHEQVADELQAALLPAVPRCVVRGTWRYVNRMRGTVRIEYMSKRLTGDIDYLPHTPSEWIWSDRSWTRTPDFAAELGMDNMALIQLIDKAAASSPGWVEAEPTR